jgi:hypothetical protein
MARELSSKGSTEVRFHGRYARMMLAPDHEDYLGVDDMDIEELARGQLKDKNGKFTGRPPVALPRQIVDAMRSEHYKRVNAELEASLSDQVKTMIAISKDPDVEASTRLKAAIYVYERFMGKVPDKINVTAQSTVDSIVDEIMFDVEEKQARVKSAVEEEIENTREELDDGTADNSRAARQARARSRQRATRTRR